MKLENFNAVLNRINEECMGDKTVGHDVELNFEPVFKEGRMVAIVMLSKCLNCNGADVLKIFTDDSDDGYDLLYEMENSGYVPFDIESEVC